MLRQGGNGLVFDDPFAHRSPGRPPFGRHRRSQGRWAMAPMLMALAACSSESVPPPPPPTVIEGCCDDPPAKVCFVHLEVEDFAGTWGVQNNIDRYYGFGFAVSNAAGVADTTMKAEVKLDAGRYVVWTRGYQDGRSRAWGVRVGGSTTADAHGDAVQNADYYWVRGGEVDVAGGETLIEIEDRGPGFEIADAVAISTDLEFDPNVDEDRWRIIPRDRSRTMLFDALEMRAAVSRNNIPTPTTQAAWMERADELRARVRTSIGMDDLPPRTPLEAQVHGTIAKNGYRVERLSFESRPGMVVSAHLYIPDGTGPFPVVLNPIGHYWFYGKTDAHVQPRLHGLALQGYAALVYDAFGQGERDVGGHAHEEGWRMALTGHTNMSVMVWDTMRALDYLETRSEIDVTRVALTGASGGGVNTLFTSVVDDRIDVAVPTVFVTEYEEIFAGRAPHDACTYLGGIAGYTDMGEIAALFAPRPQLMNAGDADTSFPSDGTVRAHAFARSVYDLFGVPDDVKVHVANSGHDYSKTMREHMYGLVDQHLRNMGDGSPVPEPNIEMFAQGDSSTAVFGTDRIPNGTTPRSLAEGWAVDAIDRLPGPGAVVDTALRTAIAATIYPSAEHAAPEVEVLEDYVTSEGVTIKRLRMDVGDGVQLPVYFAAGPEAAPVIVLTDDAGFMRPEVVADASALGVSLVYVAPRGRGETAADEHIVTGSNVLLGDSILGQRALDLAKTRRMLRTFAPTADVPVGLLALGPNAALPAIFAQGTYLEFDAVAVGPLPTTFMESFSPGLPFVSRIFGMLKVADLPHVTWLAGERPLRVQFATDVYTRYHEDWVTALPMRVDVQPELTRDSGIAWLLEQLQ